MRILITAPYLNSGGVNVFVKSIYPFFEDINIFYRGRRSQKPSCINGLFDGIVMPFRFIWKLIAIRPDKVIVNTSLGSSTLVRDGLLVLLSKLLQRKVLLIVHGFNSIALKHKFLLRMGYFKADAMIVLSNAFKEQMIARGYGKPIYTQYNPVDNACFQFFEKYSKRNLTKLHNILFLSRVEKSKGIYLAIDAFRNIASKHKDIVFNIVGNGSELEKVKLYISENQIQNVKILGFKDKEDKYKVLAENDVMLFPSYYREGLPICILEAIAAGQLILTRPLGGLIDLYEECPFGEMTGSQDPEVFADAFEKYFNNPSLTAEIRKNNREYADHFRPTKIVENIQQILNSL